MMSAGSVVPLLVEISEIDLGFEWSSVVTCLPAPRSLSDTFDFVFTLRVLTATVDCGPTLRPLSTEPYVVNFS